MKRKTRTTPFSVRRAERKTKNRLFFTIIIGIILIYAMLAWILPSLIGSLSLINRFKPASKKEISVSESSTLAPPVLNIPYEATNTATIKVSGYTQPKLSVEIYLDNELQSTAKAQDDGSFTSDDVALNLGTNQISGKTIDEEGNKSFSSKPIKIMFNNEKPVLTLNEPQDNQIIKGDKKVTVSGSVKANSDVSLTINNIRVILNSDGNFSKVIEINEGDNNIVVIATDDSGNSTQISRKVTFQTD